MLELREPGEDVAVESLPRPRSQSTTWGTGEVMTAGDPNPDTTVAHG